MIVYVVCESDYEHHANRGVFSKKEDAQALAAKLLAEHEEWRRSKDLPQYHSMSWYVEDHEVK